MWDLLDYGEKVDKSDTFQPLNGLRSNPQIGLEKLVFWYFMSIRSVLITYKPKVIYANPWIPVLTGNGMSAEIFFFCLFQPIIAWPTWMSRELRLGNKGIVGGYYFFPKAWKSLHKSTSGWGHSNNTLQVTMIYV